MLKKILITLALMFSFCPQSLQAGWFQEDYAAQNNANIEQEAIEIELDNPSLSYEEAIKIAKARNIQRWKNEIKRRQDDQQEQTRINNNYEKELNEMIPVLIIVYGHNPSFTPEEAQAAVENATEQQRIQWREQYKQLQQRQQKLEQKARDEQWQHYDENNKKNALLQAMIQKYPELSYDEIKELVQGMTEEEGQAMVEEYYRSRTDYWNNPYDDQYWQARERREIARATLLVAGFAGLIVLAPVPTAAGIVTVWSLAVAKHYLTQRATQSC